MSCEIYKSRIADAAASENVALGFSPASVLDSELAAHLKTCAACRAELDAQRALLASIDRGLASIVKDEPSGDFATHVRLRIAEKAAAPRPWFAGWMPVSAAALALLVLAVWMIGRPPQSARVQPVVPVVPVEEPRKATSPTESAREEAPHAVAAGPRTIRPPRPPQSAAIHEPEVLVPRGEMAAVTRLFNANWSGRSDGASLTSQPVPVSEALKPMTIEEMKIPALEIVPLASGEPSKGFPEK